MSAIGVADGARWGSRSGERPVVAPAVAAPLVGREHERAVLRDAVLGALSGSGGVVLLAGDAGIGKTRLAEDACAFGAEHGARTVWGRCWEETGAPAYWPWTQALRSLTRQDPLRTSAGSTTLATRPAATADDRFALFESFGETIAVAADEAPVVVVIDDLHAADPGSGVLLRFLQQQIVELPVLLIVTYRDVELRHRPELASIVDRVATGATLLPLEPLGDDDVVRLLELLAPSADAVDGICALSAGNPLFVHELAGLVAAGRSVDSLERLPAGIRGRVAGRVGLLSDAARTALRAAATIGGEVELDVLARATEIGHEDLVDLLAEAEDAGLLARDELPGVYRFPHGLVRRSVYEDMAPADRRRAHHAIGNALEVGTCPTSAAELAHHFAHGVPGTDTPKAFDYARRAGDEAMAALAYEQAASHYGAAASLATAGGVEIDDRYAGLVALGDARARAADRDGAREALRQAAALVRDRSPHLAAEALVKVPQSFAGVGARAGEADHELVAELRATLGALGRNDAALRSRVRARLATALFWTAEPSETRGMTERAVAEARRTGDEVALAVALHADRAVHSGPEHTHRRLVTADEIIRIAEGRGEHLLALHARIVRIPDRLEVGDMHGADVDIATVERAARATEDRCARWHVATWRAMRALLESRFADAEAASDDALTMALEVGDADAIESFGVQRLTQYWSQGRAADVEALLAAGVERDPPLPAWQCAMAAFHADAGRVDDARRQFAIVAADGFAGIPRDQGWTVAMASLARACAFLQDGRRASILYELLAPYHDRFVVVGPGVLWSGAVAHSLGLLASTTGDLTTAIRHFEDAIAACEDIGAPGYAAEGRRRLAEVLVARGRGGDRERARTLLHEAATTFDLLGMPSDEAAARARLVSLGATRREEPSEPAAPIASTTPITSSPPPSVARLRLEGDHWQLSFGGHEVRLKDAVGLRHLAALLAEPGRELLALDLATRGGGFDAADMGAVLDDQAKAAYRARLAELDDLMSGDDPARAAAAAAERELLAEELAAALGLGGRNRKQGSAAERARLSVTKAIKYTIRRITDRHPALGHHLQTTVHTGTYCRYEPAPSGAVDWLVER